ncbi:MAG: 30S ribosomal protein S15 [Dehalococcoidales bacterium]|nr:30S ribosomal protein S15 [Dehalococcoidales bacterium]MDD4230198.1 30S ribosomal protein S15 [Dehalococcoidales bacterium]MDD5402732.1 30S ribosomal protein S15 [Dehalococcoidales bacterium]
MDRKTKSSIIEEYKLHEGDTGSAEVQVAILTGRIKQLTRHLTDNRHDFHTKRRLFQLVGQRRRLLSYLYKEDADRYQQLIQRLGLRK